MIHDELWNVLEDRYLQSRITIRKKNLELDILRKSV